MSSICSSIFLFFCFFGFVIENSYSQPSYNAMLTECDFYITRSRNCDCSVACNVVLLKPNVANILLFNFCERKFVQNGPIMPLNQNPQQTVSRFRFVGLLMYECRFFVPQCDNFACLHSSGKMFFFFLPNLASSASRLQTHLAKRKRIEWPIGFNSWIN